MGRGGAETRRKTGRRNGRDGRWRVHWFHAMGSGGSGERKRTSELVTIVPLPGGAGTLQAVDLTRRRGDAEKDAEKKREGWKVAGSLGPRDGERKKRRPEENVRASLGLAG